MLRLRQAAAVVVGLVIAGCAGGGPASSSEPAAFDDLKGDATATTGLIRGVVVDTAIKPIAKATVQVLGATKHNLSADAQGRFLIDGLKPGTYLLKASAPLHKDAQTSVDVVASVDEPAITKILLQPLFDQKPFTVPLIKRGFFQCSQAGATPVVGYSSSNCVTDMCPRFYDDRAFCNTLPTAMMNNLTSQEREWHIDVGAGWQQAVFEMTWTPSAEGTSQNMGMTVSTFKPLRDPAHFFASVGGGNPLRFQLDVGVPHETSQIPSEDAPFPNNLTSIPASGMEQVSVFVSVRQDGFVPAIAYEQDFEVIVHQFYYGFPKEGWSFVAGDKPPF